MPREVIKHQTRTILAKDPQQVQRLGDWLCTEITDSFAARMPLEARWREVMRQYEGVPKEPVKNFPIENAPNVEVTVGAIACDDIYAQAIDLIFTASPLMTVRPIPKYANDEEAVAKAKALQRYVNWMASNEVDLRAQTENMILDDTQIGTGLFYVPFVERRKKTKVASIISSHPKLIAMPPEDVLVTGGSCDDLDELPLLALRFWNSETELAERAAVNDWDLDGVQRAGAKDWVRMRREALARQMQGMERKGNIYDTFDVYCYYDIDNDGLDEDLLVTYNHTGRKVLKVGWNPYDRRPCERAVYQRRSHLFYGLGVLEMMSPYQQELTDVHNYAVLNALIANCRMWITSESVEPNMKIWPNKQISTRDPKNDVRGEAMGDIHPSIWQLQILISQLAERRVGTSNLAQKAGAAMGNRTPGITALSMLQDQNRRFVPAFDGMRICIANALKQCLYRYQERLLAGSQRAERHFIDVLGQNDGQLVISILRNDNFDEHITMELTASSASINRDADKQNAIMLDNLLGQYYQRIVELAMLAANPQTPESVKTLCVKVASAAGEMIERTIRTFDQVRDPATFVIDMENTMADTANAASSGGIEQLMHMLGGGGQQAPSMNALLGMGGGEGASQ